MSSNQEINFTEKKFVTTNRKPVIYILAVITFLISLVFMDFYLLPKTKTNDVITYYVIKYGGGKNGRKKDKIAYNYYTEKGYSFSTANYYIEENNVEIEYTLLFKSVAKVKSKYKDYSDSIAAGFNGILFYCYAVLLFSIAVSLTILFSKKNISENTFYNIICFNSFMLFVSIYMMYLF